VAVCFFGDGTTNIGAFHEALNFSVVWKLPVVYVCENNFYMEYTPINSVTAVKHPAADRAGSYGLAPVLVDGNDADAVYALAGEAIDHARSGCGPAFLELKTYRWLEHCGPLDDRHLGYRPPGEYEAWMARDPLKLYAERLQDRGLVSTVDLQGMAREVASEIDDAVTFAKSSPFPTRDQLAAHLYAS